MKPIQNLDYECYQYAVREHAEYQEDWLATGYAPKGFYLKDFCIIEAEGVWHLFHIAGTPGVTCCLPGNELWFGHATTSDFLTWTTHEPALYIDPGRWDGGHVFAPYVVSHQGTYWMFYTGCTVQNGQRIGLATSEDLFSWRKWHNNPVIRPENFSWAFCPTELGSPCRDPHLLRLGDTFQMYYTAVTKDGRACVGRASSTDLVSWTDAGPAYVAPGMSHCESSNVQELNGKYLLFFGGHYEYWSYVVADNPYHWPEQKPIPLKKHITAMEVIARNGNQWLVAYFKMKSYRMFLGILDWSLATPEIREINEPGELVPFLPSQ